MTLAHQIEAARAEVQQAASKGYDAFTAAKAKLDALLAQERAERITAMGDKANAVVVVVGHTYPHRDALKRMGLVWDAQARGWRGTAAMLIGKSLPAGCRTSGYGAAVVASMDHEDSLA